MHRCVPPVKVGNLACSNMVRSVWLRHARGPPEDFSSQVRPQVVGVAAYLAAPNGTIIALRQGILLPQCSPTSASAPCSENTDTGPGRAGLGKDPRTGAVIGAAHSTSDAYWSGFVDASASPLAFPLVRQTPALETFVTLCADAVQFPQTLDCTRRPINNYFSPVSRFPRIIEVAVTPQVLLNPRRFISSDRSAWYASSPPIAFQSYDLDGQMMSTYIAGMGAANARNSTLRCWMGQMSDRADCSGTSCLEPWKQYICRGGRNEGKPCFVDTECGTGTCGTTWSLFRLYFDADRNRYNVAGNLIMFDFDYAPQLSTDALVGRIPYGTRRFTQHVLTSVDHPFLDVDNPMSSAGVDVPGDHVKAATWRTGAASVMSVSAAFGCDAGTANQPPRFVASFGTTAIADFNVITEVISPDFFVAINT